MGKKLIDRFRLNKKISSQIMRAIVFINILMLLVIYIALYYFFENVVGDEALKMAQAQLEINVKTFNEGFDHIESATKVLNSSLESEFSLQRALREDVYLENFADDLVPQLKKIGEEVEFATSVYVFFNHDLFNRGVDAWLLQEDENFVRQPITSKSYFDDPWEWYDMPIKNRKAIWTYPYEDVNEQGESFIFSSFTRPIVVEGITVGVSGMDIKLTDLAESLNNHKIYESGDLYLLHRDGRMVIEPEQEVGKLPGENPIFDPWIFQMTHEDKGIIEFHKESTDWVLAFSHLNNEWIMVAVIPKREVFGLTGQMLIFMSVLVIISILISFIFADIIGKRISKPVEILNESLMIIGGGDLTYSVPTDLSMYGNEIASLFKSAEIMRYQMEQAFQRMQLDNEELESMVEERTFEIIQVNLELKESLKKLEEQQLMLIEADRYKTSRFLIQNLAHRLNTPISSTIMSVDYIFEMFKGGDAVSSEDIKESLEIIEVSQQSVKEIVDSLNHLLEPYENTVYESVLLQDAVNIGVGNFRHDAGANMQCDVNIREDFYVWTSSILLYKLVQQMLEIASKGLESHQALNVSFEAEEVNDVILLKFKDFNAIIEDDPSRFFVPFSNQEFKSDSSGLELFILYDMVNRGLDASVEINTLCDGCLEIQVGFKKKSIQR